MNERKWVAGIVPLLVLPGLLAFAAGCRKLQEAIPAPSSPTPLVAQVTPLPNGAGLLHVSQDALERLPVVGLVERLTSYRAPGAPPLVVAQEACFRLEGSGGWEEGPFLSSVESEYPDALDRRTICAGDEARQTCHTQVNNYPWFRDSTVEAGPPWPKLRRELLAGASASGRTTLAEDGTIFVTWSAESTLFVGLALRGESWLDASSLRPRREIIGWYSQDMLSVRQEIVYTDCAGTEQLGLPPLATVTPSAPIAHARETAEFREESVPLPGALYVPEGEGPFPAVAVLHGSEGGFRNTGPMARRLAGGGLVALAHSGCGIRRVDAGSCLGNSSTSSCSSVSPSGSGQLTPAALARATYSLTLPAEIPQAAAIFRCDRPVSYFNLNISSILRMDNLGWAISSSSFRFGKSMPHLFGSIQRCSRSGSRLMIAIKRNP